VFSTIGATFNVVVAIAAEVIAVIGPSPSWK
jgi:hypothetical protein